MASLSGLPALDINPIGIGAQDSTAMSNSQIAYANAQKAQILDPLEEEQAQATIPLAIQKAKQDAALQTQDYGRRLVANTLGDVRAAEAAGQPASQIAQIWDSGMQRAKDSGYDAAGQYIGHYQIGLSERLGDVYGGGGGKSPAETAAEAKIQESNQQAMDRAVAAMPPDQLRKAYQNQNMAINGWNRVATGGKAAWDEEMANLKAAGIDPVKDGHLTSTEYSTLNYAAAARFIQNLVPMRDAMQRRLLAVETGGPDAQPAPIGTEQYVGVEPGTNKPIAMNTVTGNFKTGNVSIGPKPTGTIAAFQWKQQAAINAGYSPADALQFANGRKQLPDERIRDMAMSEANREYGNEVLAGANIPNADAWIKAKAAENYRTLTQGAPQAAPGSPGNAAGQPPQRAIQQLQKAGGQALRFPNGQVWAWRNGRAVRVQ